MGNVFAVTIADHCRTNADRLDSNDYPLLTEKFWYYKDGSESEMLGPFSTVEMYKWSISGYFSKELEVAFNNTSRFYPVVKVTKAPILDDPDSRASTYLDNADGSYEIKFVSSRQNSI